MFAAAYLRNRQLEGIDVVTLYRHAKAIGLLYDYYTLQLESPPLDEQRMQLLIKQFWEARRFGCPGLGWKPVTYKTARDDLNAVNEFSDFCSENFGHAHINPQERVLVSSLSQNEFRAWLAKTAHRKKTDLLFHLVPATKEGRGELRRRRFGLKRKPQGRTRNGSSLKHFPPDKALEFIRTTESLRNRLCWLLMFFGSVRISELAHLFVGDILLDPSDNSARVVLADPLDGQMQWAALGKQRNGTRAAFLLEKYGRVPRTELPTRNPEHAGWKGMTLEDENRNESLVHWSHPQIGALFWKLHTAYMRAARLHIGDEHPYYFVSLKGNSYGEPMKLGALRKQFYAAALRIGLSPSTGGVNPHGARHFYGWYCANVLKLPKERTQKLMHHSSMLSTEVYYKLDQATLKAELEAAQARLQQQMPSFLKDDRLLLTLENDDE
ncbi:hypothetical protein ACQ858_09590 [Variovorax ureilyticus]|uniref:hypothetical protein n=1 Tax=Variovorax ureilyticus TaxID=1836198 RepID=UPI003D66A4C8